MSAAVTSAGTVERNLRSDNNEQKKVWSHIHAA